MRIGTKFLSTFLQCNLTSERCSVSRSAIGGTAQLVTLRASAGIPVVANLYEGGTQLEPLASS
jgi:hypothetical protein